MTQIRRDKLEPGMVFETYMGPVRLSHRTLGDGTNWDCEIWVKDHFYWECSEFHPDDFETRLTGME